MGVGTLKLHTPKKAETTSQVELKLRPSEESNQPHDKLPLDSVQSGVEVEAEEELLIETDPLSPSEENTDRTLYIQK